MTPSFRSPPAYDICGIGNALMDLEYAVDDSFLRDSDLVKGHMTLVDEDRMEALMASLADHEPRYRSGGSAANTVFAVKGFGGRSVYSCRVARDPVGDRFLQDMHRAGIDTIGNHGNDGKSGRCLTLITDDAERTMTTFLGVSEHLSVDDLDDAVIAESAHLYMEGYLAASASGCAAAVRARELAEAERVPVNVSFSDPSMVVACRHGLERMLGNGVAQLFCNEEEALLWAGTDRLDVAAVELGDIAPYVNITLGARGSLVLAKRKRTVAPGHPSDIVDTTGAGDMYAGAVVHARAHGADPLDAARFANFAAAEVVSKHGARLHGIDDYAALKRRFRANGPWGSGEPQGRPHGE